MPQPATTAATKAPAIDIFWLEESPNLWRGLHAFAEYSVAWDHARRNDWAVLRSEDNAPFRTLEGKARDEVVESLVAWLAANGREIPEAPRG